MRNPLRGFSDTAKYHFRIKRICVEATIRDWFKDISSDTKRGSYKTSSQKHSGSSHGSSFTHHYQTPRGAPFPVPGATSEHGPFASSYFRTCDKAGPSVAAHDAKPDPADEKRFVLVYPEAGSSIGPQQPITNHQPPPSLVPEPWPRSSMNPVMVPSVSELEKELKEFLEQHPSSDTESESSMSDTSSVLDMFGYTESVSPTNNSPNDEGGTSSNHARFPRMDHTPFQTPLCQARLATYQEPQRSPDASKF